MARWKKTTRMRRAYLGSDNITKRPVNSGIHKEGMGLLYNHMPTPNHSQAFGDGGRLTEPSLHALFAELQERQFNSIKNLMKSRARMLEAKHIRLTIRDKMMWVVLRNARHFKLVLFWGSSRYLFIKYQGIQGLVSISKPYPSRDLAMEAYDNNEIFYLDFIRIPA
jgi:hypothetical protein